MKKLIALIILIGGIAGCGPAPTSKQLSMEDTHPIQYRLQFEPNPLPLSEIDQVQVILSAVNSDLDTLAPRLANTELFINGEVAVGWQLTVQNGRRPAEWFQLPGGASVEQSWTGLASNWFSSAGTYALELRLEDTVVWHSDIEVKE